jgi:hypothetical protein
MRGLPHRMPPHSEAGVRTCWKGMQIALHRGCIHLLIAAVDAGAGGGRLAGAGDQEREGR